MSIRPGPRIIIAYKPGQLSNRLLQFATFIAFSERTGIPILNLGFDEYADQFDATRHDLLCRYPPRRSSVPPSRLLRQALYAAAYTTARAIVRLGYRSRRVRVVSPDWNERLLLDEAFAREIGDASVVFVQGWRIFVPASVEGQECVGPPGGIEPEASLIRAFFRPAGDAEGTARDLVATARRGCDRLVGVHIRQGDFLTDKNQGRYYYPTEQYVVKMREVIAAFPEDRVGFLVCSNVPQRPELFEGLPSTFAGATPLVEQLALSGCDQIIGPPSSFSMWAAFMGRCQLHWIFDLNERIVPTSFRPFAPIDQDEVAERYYGYANAKEGAPRPRHSSAPSAAADRERTL